MPEFDFTEEERNIINDIYRRNFQDMTPEEVQLLIRWERYNALLDDYRQTRTAEQKRYTDALIADSETVKEAALSSIDTLMQAALERYEESKGGMNDGEIA